MKNENRFITFIKENIRLLAIVTGLLVFLAFLFPLANAHGVEYNPDTWVFDELDRTTHGCGILFGLDGAVAWPLLIQYSMVFVAILFLFLSILNNRLAVISMVIFLVTGVLLLFSNYLYSYSNALATARTYADYFGEKGTEEYFGNFYWYVKEYVNIADPRLEAGSIYAAVMCFVSAIITFSSSYSKERITVGEMTEMGILISAAVVLDIIFHLIPNIPGQVGSISIALLPLYFLSLRHGPIKGLFAASFVYGLITCFTDNYGIWLYPLDYMVAFSGVAIIGLFKKQILEANGHLYNFKALALIFISVMLAGVVRMIGSGASSILNYNYPFGLAVIANGLYTTISSLLCAIILMVNYPHIVHLNTRFPVRSDFKD